MEEAMFALRWHLQFRASYKCWLCTADGNGCGWKVLLGSRSWQCRQYCPPCRQRYPRSQSCGSKEYPHISWSTPKCCIIPSLPSLYTKKGYSCITFMIFRLILDTFTNIGGGFMTQKQEKKLHTHMFTNSD